MSRTPTPLPELEQQLRAAAQRLDATAPARTRRRWWRHGWSLLSVVIVAAGASVAVARVAEVGPFAYMSGFGAENPKLAPTSVITVQEPGAAPGWQARATLNGLGQVCLTGGPRDPRTNPDARPTTGRPNNPPQNGVLCASSEEIAQDLVDPDRRGASFGHASDLDGSLQGRMCRMTVKTGRCVPVATDPPTRMLVYVVRAAGAPSPVVRWGASGSPIPMQASEQRLRMPVDRSPDGLSPQEQVQVARYPAHIDLVLWVADVAIPSGVQFPQLAYAAQLAPHGIDDATVEMLGREELLRLDREGRRRGWKYERGISRDAPPVRRANAAQRRWIAAFARPRTSADAVPQRLRTKQAAFERFGYSASRKLLVVGGGVRDVWIAPGGMTEDMPVSERADQICFLGAALLRQCKYGQRRWKRPFAEAVSCTQGAGWPTPLAGGRTLIWALSPPRATGVELHGPGKQVETLGAGELLAVSRPASDRITAIVWTSDAGERTRVRVPWPKKGPRCERGAPGDQMLRKDNAGSYELSAGRPPATR